ncbi:hypothetical protein HPB49_006965 [Dermacentor silvarum]|uniref:Uncharacterized protein n=1 Tax=Dermacentor silvarum TaxID=543639 RepID=A0ACB8C2I1_DERSI|nr:hypothetical protein HPB49_006965 [Dermacentor silvarum]
MCHVCDRGFHQRGHLNSHMLVHVGERPHEWPDCGQRFIRASHMALHQKLQHSAESARHHVCPECGKGFTRRHLITHQLTHMGTKPNACS